MPSNQVLLHEMDVAIKQFDAGRLSFRGLLDRLVDCVDNLANPDPVWEDAFRRAWGRMEDSYAFAASEGLKAIRDIDMPAIELALKEIRRLVAQKIA
jgi:hypothetical protein